MLPFTDQLPVVPRRGPAADSPSLVDSISIGVDPVTTVYSAGRRVLRVRALMWFTLLMAAFAVWSGYGIMQSYGLRPADGGVLAPLPVRLAFGGGIALLGLAFLAGMALYGRCYVDRLDYDAAAGTLVLRTVGWLGGSDRTLSRSDILGSRHHDARDWLSSWTVHAPWTTIRLRDRRLPFILDTQGEFRDREVLRLP